MNKLFVLALLLLSAAFVLGQKSCVDECMGKPHTGNVSLKAAKCKAQCSNQLMTTAVPKKTTKVSLMIDVKEKANSDLRTLMDQVILAGLKTLKESKLEARTIITEGHDGFPVTNVEVVVEVDAPATMDDNSLKAELLKVFTAGTTALPELGVTAHY
jgi:hypothetical protein